MKTSAPESSRCALNLALALALVTIAPLWAQASPTVAIAPAEPSTPSQASPAAPPVPPHDQLVNARDPFPGLRTGGVPPTAEVYARLAAEGFVTFVDLRPEPELSAAARAGAEAAGMRYIQIPVGSDVDLDLGSVRALDEILDDPARSPVALVCASGNRSGALLALRAFWLDGKPADEALALGKSAGLTRLEPSVRRLLGLPALPAAAPPAPPQN